MSVAEFGETPQQRPQALEVRDAEGVRADADNRQVLAGRGNGLGEGFHRGGLRRQRARRAATAPAASPACRTSRRVTWCVESNT